MAAPATSAHVVYNTEFVMQALTNFEKEVSTFGALAKKQPLSGVFSPEYNAQHRVTKEKCQEVFNIIMKWMEADLNHPIGDTLKIYHQLEAVFYDTSLDLLSKRIEHAKGKIVSVASTPRESEVDYDRELRVL